MIRSNVGNVVTNAMQIASVSAHTAAGMVRSAKKDKLAQAQNALNNLSDEERSRYVQMQADKMREQTEQYYGKASSPTQHMSLQEQEDYQSAVAESRRKFTKKQFEQDDETESVDDIMQGLELKVNSPQGEELALKPRTDVQWLDDWKSTWKKVSDLKKEKRSLDKAKKETEGGEE